MTGIVVWWYCQEDGAVHAFYRRKLGHGHAILNTVCDLDVLAFQVERHDDGPKCLACQLIVGPR